MKKKKPRERPSSVLKVPEAGKERKFEVVLKCDSSGSLEAVDSSIETIRIPGVEVETIHSGVGDIIKSDLLLAVTGSRLIVGFNVGIGQKIEQLCKEQGIEVRLYHVIYRLVDDLRKIADSLTARDEEEEKIIGKARVIALFKSGRKDVILGCEVIKGSLIKGRKFRIFSAMGLIHTGKIESLQIEKTAVAEAGLHQQVGLKILKFKKTVKIGDIIECFESARAKDTKAWQPKGGVFEIE